MFWKSRAESVKKEEVANGSKKKSVDKIRDFAIGFSHVDIISDLEGSRFSRMMASEAHLEELKRE